ncbi:MAG: hypothetical protein HQM15_05530 [Deltaproteobacteria bacterium]|nr:hypothetical protein [Deltaproteobacteria bacterium]
MLQKKFKLYSEIDFNESTSYSRLAKPWNLYAKHLLSIFPTLKLLKSFYKVPHQNSVVDFVALRKPQELVFVWYCPNLQWYGLSKLLPIFLRVEENFKEIVSTVPQLNEKEHPLKPIFLLMTATIDTSLLSCLKYFQGLSLEVLQFRQEKNKIETLHLFSSKEPANSSKKKEFEMVSLSEEERMDFMSIDSEEIDEEAEEWK